MIKQTARNILTLMFLLVAVVVAKAEDSAVIVGINDYMTITPDLRFCEADAALMKGTLITYLGIKEENIKMLLGRAATKNGIEMAIRDWLKNRVNPGDKAIFYFSGHGTQFADFSGDEYDGQDEMLCVYDSDKRIRTYIKDDNLNRWFAEIKTNFKLVILDCCHSGTGTKEVLIGGLLNAKDVPTIKEGRLPAGIEIEPDTAESQARGVGDVSKDVFKDTILISGCKAEQVSRESPQYEHGVLTYFFTKVLNGQADVNGDGVVTIEEAVREAKKRIKEKGWEQDPQLEGNSKDIVLVAKKELKETVYGTIDNISTDVITISLGREHNVVKDAIYNVFDSNVSLFVDGTHKGRILIHNVMRNYSRAKLIKASYPLNVGDKVVEYKRDFQPEKLLLLIEPFKSRGQSEYIARGIERLMKKSLSKKEYVEIVRDKRLPDKIVRGSVKKGPGNKYEITVRLVDVKRAEGKDYEPIETTYFGLNQAADRLDELLSGEIQYGYNRKALSQLENTRSGFRVNLAFDKGNGGNFLDSQRTNERSQGGGTSAKSATFPQPKVTVTVKPTQDCYIYLLNAATSGAINIIFPNLIEDNNFVQAGQEYVVPIPDEYASGVCGQPSQGAVKAIATLQKIPLEMLNPGAHYEDNIQNVLEITMKNLGVNPLNQWATENIIVSPRDGK